MYFQADYAHEGPVFGSWHRVFLDRTEQMMRAVCGIDYLTLFGWDWLNGDDEVIAATIALMGGNGTGQIIVATGDNVSEAVYATEIAEGYPFGDLQVIDHLGNKTGHRITRHVGEEGSHTSRTAFLAALLSASAWDCFPYNTIARLACSARQVIEGFAAEIQSGMRWSHNLWHMYIGGGMAYVKTSPNDPLFFSHHTTVDFTVVLRHEREPLSTLYPTDEESPMPVGHRHNDYMVPFMPPVTAAEGMQPSLSSRYSSAALTTSVNIVPPHYHINLHASFDALQRRYPDMVRLIPLSPTARSVQGRMMYAVQVSSTGFTNDSSVPIALLTAGLHSNDIVTKQLTVAMVESLANRTMSTRFDVHILFDCNPDGTSIVWLRDETQRKNANGVDINRNFPLGYSLTCGGSSDPDAPDYKGSSPASEPETQAIIDYLSLYPPALHIDVQATGRLMRVPYGGCASLPEPVRSLFVNITQHVADGAEGYLPADSFGMGNAVSYTHGRYGAYSVLVEMGEELQPTAAAAEEEIIRLLPAVQRALAMTVPLTVVVVDRKTNKSIAGAVVAVEGVEYVLGEEWKTDRNGVQRLWVAAQQSVNISVVADGFASASVRVDVTTRFDAADGEETTLLLISLVSSEGSRMWSIGMILVVAGIAAVVLAVVATGVYHGRRTGLRSGYASIDQHSGRA